MPRPALRSRSLRRVKKRTPSGRNVIHYTKKKPGKAICSNCRRPLQGVPRERPHKIKNMGKTELRPERPYGGNLCSGCMRSRIKERKLYS